MICGLFFAPSSTCGSLCLVLRSRTFFPFLGTYDTRAIFFVNANNVDLICLSWRQRSCRGSSGLIFSNCPNYSFLKKNFKQLHCQWDRKKKKKSTLSQCIPPKIHKVSWQFASPHFWSALLLEASPHLPLASRRRRSGCHKVPKS